MTPVLPRPESDTAIVSRRCTPRAADRDERPAPHPLRVQLRRWMGIVGIVVFSFMMFAPQAGAQEPTPPTPPDAPAAEQDAATDADGDDVTVSLPDGADRDQTVGLILLLTLLGLGSSLLMVLTSFTRFVIVFSLARMALGTPTIPPNQVIVGLSLFMSLFVMGPVLSEMNTVALEPYLAEEISTTEAIDAASVPLREWMLANTRTEELEMFTSRLENPPETAEETPMTALIPAFVLSEIRAAFIIGFVIFVPFLVIDLVVSAVLLSLGMMMLPPSFVTTPLKILLFVVLGGWTLLTETLLNSFRGFG